MSEPSALHESRVSTLAELATLAGYSVDVQLASSLRPDVCRLHSTRPSLLVSDAKATERPGDAETRRRLMAYTAAAHMWLSAGFDVAIGICHGADPQRHWERCLSDIIAMSRLFPRRVSVVTIEPETWITVSSVLLAN
jgi:hypothetical protein